MSEFHYLNQSGVYYIPNVNDKQDWQRMLVRPLTTLAKCDNTYVPHSV